MTEERLDDDAQVLYLTALLERGYKFKLRTMLFGKAYVWIEDTTGNHFLERTPMDGVFDG